MTLLLGVTKRMRSDNIKGLLKQKFQMKDLGDLCYFLGIEVIHTPDSIWLS